MIWKFRWNLILRIKLRFGFFVHLSKNREIREHESNFPSKSFNTFIWIEYASRANLLSLFFFATQILCELEINKINLFFATRSFY